MKTQVTSSHNRSKCFTYVKITPTRDFQTEDGTSYEPFRADRNSCVQLAQHNNAYQSRSRLAASLDHTKLIGSRKLHYSRTRLEIANSCKSFAIHQLQDAATEMDAHSNDASPMLQPVMEHVPPSIPFSDMTSGILRFVGRRY